MLMSDRDIRLYMEQGHIAINPFDSKFLQSASVDLRLEEIETHVSFIAPGEFCLASTIEVIGVSDHVAAQVAGKSSIARCGLIVEAAGWIDPGFQGQITLEMHNMSSHPIPVLHGDPICQVVFFALMSPCERPYHGKYQNQIGITPDRTKVER